MIPAQILSGNLVCVTQFKAYDKVIHESCYRIFYDWNKLGLIFKNVKVKT